MQIGSTGTTRHFISIYVTRFIRVISQQHLNTFNESRIIHKLGSINATSQTPEVSKLLMDHCLKANFRGGLPESSIKFNIPPKFTSEIKKNIYIDIYMEGYQQVFWYDLFIIRSCLKNGIAYGYLQTRRPQGLSIKACYLKLVTQLG